jgi:hypothetical protein
MMLLIVVVDVLLLELRWRGVYTTKLIVVVAVLKILHLEKIVIATSFLVAKLLMHRVPHTFVLILLRIVHLNHVVTLRFGRT